MKLVTADLSGSATPGIAIDGKVLFPNPAAKVLPGLSEIPGSVKGIIAGGAPVMDALKAALGKVAGAEAALTSAGALVDEASVSLMAPIPEPTLILSCGMNYHEHLREMDTPAPATPTGFTKNAASVTGSGQNVLLPKSAPDKVDWEGEFTAVIGKEAFAVSEDKALDHVFGYTIINDISARDWIPPVFTAVGNMKAILAWEHNILGKQFPTFCPMGPAIVTADEVGDATDLKLQTRLNGTVMQDTRTSDLVYGVAKLIAYFSQFYRLRPGDLITTGSPSGVGVGRKPPIFMQPGDVIEVEVERIGILRNPIAMA